MTLTDHRKAQLLIWAAKIDLAMAERQITQAKLARLMDTDRGTICRLLQGHDVRASTYLQAFEVLGIALEPRVLQKSA
jgi:transcriptional regulator with XRE-family HTH domain